MSTAPEHVRSIRDATTQAFDWGTLAWLWNGAIAADCRQTVGISAIEPASCNPAHYHPNCDEVLYVLSGEGRHRLADDWVALAAGDSIWIPTGVHHQLINTGVERLVCLVAFSSPDRQTVFVP